jgi:hypothetical protein
MVESCPVGENTLVLAAPGFPAGKSEIFSIEYITACCSRSKKLDIKNFRYYFNFEHVHPVVFILMYWIYLLPSAQQTIGYNGFTSTCFDSHKSSSGYVQNLSVLAVLLLTVSCSGDCWSM